MDKKSSAPHPDSQSERTAFVTSLNEIREHQPCSSGWNTLLKALGKTKSDDSPLPLSFILQSNGVEDCIWTFRCFPERSKETAKIRQFSRWCALQVINKWDAPAVVLEYLVTGDESIRSASYAAARAAADAVYAAARAAIYAARPASYAAADAIYAAADAARAAADATVYAARPASYAAADAVYAVYAAAYAADAAADAALAAARENQKRYLQKMFSES